ncbi:NDR1/HIN1-like protein 2 [Rutidosis leptorrhynchoides]|uniref:NDR1/HIN1-like protein 2 n=1 Tax=Rutidosis leptorrhynchoides TaxID=125765 RepID=UPI003A99F22C
MAEKLERVRWREGYRVRGKRKRDGCGFMVVVVTRRKEVICAVITTNNTPEVDVNDVTLTRFMLSPTKNKLYYYVAANMTFRNPYSNYVGIYFDIIDVDLMYQGQRLGTKEMPDVFYLPPNEEKSVMNVVLRGEHVLQLINGDEKLVYASENKSGVYKIGVKARIVMRSRVMWVNTEKHTYKIICDNLEVPLTSGQV